MSEWISVKDRLPGLNRMIIVALSEGDVYVGELLDAQEGMAEWYVHDYGGEAGVTHWTPLPDPPSAPQFDEADHPDPEVY